MWLEPKFWIGLFEIFWINILLSGDNAVVIAMACRNLSPRERRLGIILGTIPAVFLLIVFTLGISYLLEIPFLKFAGGIVLLWIGAKLLLQESEREIEPAHSPMTIWSAVRTIVIADIVMSFDNVVAVAAAAHGNRVSLVFGLIVSTPIVMFGSVIVLALLNRFPILVNAGAALLGWIAGDVIVGDPYYAAWIGANASFLEFGAPVLGAVTILASKPVRALFAMRSE